ncbi:MAG: T9SS type A sorting domain-containing protein [Candidatus Syntrophosphaera sp.]|nr:T9SS type A sorting domain-containing protein [Candidatus Syntrophosphaera sp.]
MRSGFIALLLVASGILGAVKLTPGKFYQNQPLRQHPHTHLLNNNPQTPKARKSVNFNKLLVILVDFQEEVPDDPNTTGNGKFLTQVDLSYPHPVGSPPHNRSYFLDNLEALRYYYLAASHGSYDLEYEVYPQTGAYTLPRQMGYYNPPGASGDLFVARMEEYFKASFEIADSLSPEIDFSAYGHFMIIHAGSDWQHDIFGDTPSDIPSFFIKVGEGKEAVVDGGSVLISHASNVPSTISQDFYAQESDGQVVRGGYGALNAVIAHEFGHSIGLVDLYNVFTFQPMVGVFDIMDSGGSGILVDELSDGSYILIEGALPALPGAWSRALLFEDYLLDNGYMVDLAQAKLFTPMQIAASSLKQNGNQAIPQILRIPLSATEYILVENRSVDPDGDGGTAVFATDDRRVILYPTPFADPQNNPTYEYDYLLPSFQAADGAAIGGGLLVWRINDDVIYNQGATDSQGNWYSNFENNTVNTLYTQRGVQVIEADNLADIGHIWSYYWTGTQYEYFHSKKPILDASGFFVQWSQEDWKPVLNGETSPPLQDSRGIGSQYWLSDIGHPAANMSLTLRSGFFDHTQIETYQSPGLYPGPTINSSYSDLDIPLLSNDSVRLLSYDGNDWVDLMGAFPWNGQPVDHPVIRADQNGNGYYELALVHGNSLELLEFSTDNLHSMSFNYPDDLSTPPLYLDGTLIVSTASSLSSIQNDTVSGCVPISGVKRLGSYGNDRAALASDILYLIDPSDHLLYVKSEIALPEPFGNYEPVSFSASLDNVRMLFLMADSGNIYKFQDGLLTQIFHNASANRPTQMGLTNWYTYSSPAINPVLFWACGSKIYAAKHDGTLLWGYPHEAFPLSFTPQEHVYAMQNHPQLYLYLPLAGRGHAAYSVADETIIWNQSLALDGVMRGSRLTLDPVDQLFGNLFWYYADPEGDLFIHRTEVPLNGFGLWNGFRNGGRGSYEGYRLQDTEQSGADSEFYAYVFPNPVTGPQFRVRIGNFDQTCKLVIYDINGSLLQNLNIPANGILRRDLILDSGKLSSGVYILSIQCGEQRKRLKFAVEK